ncbi:MAG: PQQ-dependent sugar dehydrogenase [Chloroflexi bacterium]|nr:PQQ-dependent sugar dehydrogenase [Chloroflexota bacterium]
MSPQRRVTSIVAPAVIVAVIALATACGGGSTDSPTPTSEATERYQLVPALGSISLEGHLVGFTMLPGSDNEAVVLTQDGLLWRVFLDETSPAVLFGDISDRIPAFDTGLLEEFGLLGIAFSPEVQSNGQVYLYYTPIKPPGITRLSRFLVVTGAVDVDSERILLDIPVAANRHLGGQLTFGPDGYLYLGVGHGSRAEHGQDLSTLPGSILRIDVSDTPGSIISLDMSGTGYRLPPDNPFLTTPNARPEIYAYGLRNPWRFSFDSVTGDLWAADVGEDLWEEVNRIVLGGNYGWNITEGLECYSAPSCDTDGLRQPEAMYGHDEGCSVTGGYVYRGAMMPELNGWYVYGDFCEGTIWALNTVGDSLPILLVDMDELITSFAELPDGELLILTWNGQIFRLAAAS